MSLAVRAIAWQSAKSMAWTPLIKMMRKQNHINLVKAARKNHLVTAAKLAQKEGGPFCGTTLFSLFAKLLPLAIRHGRTLFNLRLLHLLLITALFHIGRAC